jgi:hypothetical protein
MPLYRIKKLDFFDYIYIDILYIIAYYKNYKSFGLAVSPF